MCVVPDGKKIDKVIGFKIIRVGDSELVGIKGYRFEQNKLHISISGPGFHAFQSEQDAKSAAINWSGWFTETYNVYSVVMYNAQLGIIQKMSSSDDGKIGIIAERIIVGAAQ